MDFIITKWYDENGQKVIGASRVKPDQVPPLNLREAREFLKNQDRRDEIEIAIIRIEENEAIKALMYLSEIDDCEPNGVGQTLERIVASAFLEGVKAKNRGRV